MKLSSLHRRPAHRYGNCSGPAHLSREPQGRHGPGKPPAQRRGGILRRRRMGGPDQHWTHHHQAATRLRRPHLRLRQTQRSDRRDSAVRAGPPHPGRRKTSGHLRPRPALPGQGHPRVPAGPASRRRPARERAVGRREIGEDGFTVEVAVRRGPGLVRQATFAGWDGAALFMLRWSATCWRRRSALCGPSGWGAGVRVMRCRVGEVGPAVGAAGPCYGRGVPWSRRIPRAARHRSPHAVQRASQGAGLFNDSCTALPLNTVISDRWRGLPFSRGPAQIGHESERFRTPVNSGERHRRTRPRSSARPPDRPS